MPDLIGYWLTGVAGRRADERLDDGLFDVAPAGLGTGADGGARASRRRCFPTLRQPGRRPRARCADDVATETGLSARRCVTLVGSHDTASAVVAVPAAERPFAYIACGTWSLVGLELEPRS